MRIAAIAGLFACGVIFAASSSSVHAETVDLLTMNSNEQKPLTVQILSSATSLVQEELTEPQQPAPEPSPTVHEVGSGETLSSIAKKHQTTWERLFNKNEQITHPDVIKVGEKVTVPLPDEELKQRPLPEPPAQQAEASETRLAPAKKTRRDAQTRAAKPAGSAIGRRTSAGNRYVPGYCTWYAKNRRPDLPNNLGNANTWVARAAAQGIPTGSAPRVGAIGQQGMHVVYVEGVNGDGTVTVSEMNFRGRYVISSRTVPASTFRYIY